MRRADREIADKEEMFRVIDRAPYCHMAPAADGERITFLVYRTISCSSRR